MTAPRILIVDDEPNIRDLLTTSLRFAGFAVRAVGNGAQAISAVLEEEPDLIILDVMLPDMNGFGVTKRLRASRLHRADPLPHRQGRHRGQDHRPHGRRRRLRHQAVQPRRDRRAHQGHPAPHDAGRRGGHHPRRRAHDGPGHPRGPVGDEPVELSPTEFKLLRYLMLNPNRVLSKAQILDHVWEYDFNGDAGIVESYISYLRRKLDQHSTEPIIQTKRGFGYMLKAAKSLTAVDHASPGRPPWRCTTHRSPGGGTRISLRTKITGVTVLLLTFGLARRRRRHDDGAAQLPAQQGRRAARRALATTKSPAAHRLRGRATSEATFAEQVSDAADTDYLVAIFDADGDARVRQPATATATLPDYPEPHHARSRPSQQRRRRSRSAERRRRPAVARDRRRRPRSTASASSPRSWSGSPLRDDRTRSSPATPSSSCSSARRRHPRRRAHHALLVTITFAPLRDVEAHGRAIRRRRLQPAPRRRDPEHRGRPAQPLAQHDARAASTALRRPRDAPSTRCAASSATPATSCAPRSSRCAATPSSTGWARSRTEDVAQAMDRIESEAIRMGELVEDLLELARLDETPAARLRPVDLLPDRPGCRARRARRRRPPRRRRSSSPTAGESRAPDARRRHRGAERAGTGARRRARGDRARRGATLALAAAHPRPAALATAGRARQPTPLAPRRPA